MGYFPEAELLVDRVHNIAVRDVFIRTDRSLFVPDSQKESAWADHPLPIEDGATISQPSLVAQMTEWLEPTAECRVLEIGTGSGYQTTLLAQLAASVYTVEISGLLSSNAQARLKSLGYSNIHFRIGDGADGWPGMAPFDRVIATVAFGHRPDSLLDQLAPEGICLVPVGRPGETQQLIRYRKTSTAVTEDSLCAVRFLSLR
jgi:protein-L-isoaspartate(D-aspartate) O-methyltransferase